MGVGDPWWENLINDVLHIAWLLVPLGLVPLVAGEPYAIALGAVAGTAHGLVIELLKETPDSWDTWRDVAGYVVGGTLGGLVLWLGF